MSLYLGIDFGTSTNYVTRWNEEKKAVEDVTALAGYGQRPVFPNVIYYDSEGKAILGDGAVKKGIGDPENCVYAVKRRIEEKGFHQYIPNIHKELNSRDIARDIFSCMKQKVEEAYGSEKIDGCVVSVPFSFQHQERDIIKRAAENAGLKVIGLIEEPVAAALSFGIADEITTGKREKILIFDLGGGTFDVTIFDFFKISNTQFNIEVLTTDGKKDLGGLDIDNLIMGKMQDELEKENPSYKMSSFSINNLSKEASQMRKEAIDAKIGLSDDEEYNVFFTSQANPDIVLDWDLALEEFNQWLEASGYLADIENALEVSLLDANLEKEDISRIILVGGTSNIPAIQDLVRNFFNKEPEKVKEPDMMVGEGAAIYCGICLNPSVDYRIVTRVSHAIGIKRKGKFMSLIERNSPYGQPSKIIDLPIKRKNREKNLDVYQGNQLHADKVGRIHLPVSLLEKISESYLGIQLNTDKNGMILYTIYDVKNNDYSKIIDGIIEEV